MGVSANSGSFGAERAAKPTGREIRSEVLNLFYNLYSSHGDDYMLKTPKAIYFDVLASWTAQYRGYIEAPLLGDPRYDGWRGLDDPTLQQLFDQPLGAAYTATVRSISQDLNVSLF